MYGSSYSYFSIFNFSYFRNKCEHTENFKTVCFGCGWLAKIKYKDKKTIRFNSRTESDNPRCSVYILVIFNKPN